MNTRKRAFTIAASLMLLILLATLAPLAAVTATPPEQEALDKIEPLVLEELTRQGQTDYFIWLTEKADLSPAGQLQTKEEKGRFVYETLRATAERTQAPLRAYLDAQGVDYQAYYIANKVLIRGGDEALLLTVAARPDVAQVTANHVIQLEEPVVDPNPPPHLEAVEPNLTFVNADLVWALGITGTGTVLAGNDTGLDETHPAIAPHYRGCMDPPTCTVWDHNYNWWDATGTFPADPWDDKGHGTHTTGTMVGDDDGTNQIGMAPGAQTIHCKNMDQNGRGQEAWFVECFQWDLAPWDLNGLNPDPAMAPDAVNNSWGHSGGDNPTYEDEIAALQAAGVLVEVSAGNEGPDCATLRSPGDYRQVLTTGSVDHAGGMLPGTLTGFSSRGPSSLYPVPPDYFPDVMAPGENIRSSIPGGGYEGGWSGTSMAGPHSVGLAGLIWSACPNLRGKVAPTVQIIQYTAVPLSGQGGSNCGGDYTNGPNNDWGHGTIDALAAVQEALAWCNSVGYLDGHVHDAGSGLPLEAATVSGDRTEGGFWIEGTDAAGYYTMTALAGTYTVTAGAFGYYPAAVTGVAVLTGAITTQDFSLTAMPAYVVSGTVSDFHRGTPLSASVTVLDTPLAPAWTDPATGFYAITAPSGTYTFRAQARGFRVQERPVVVDGDQTQDFHLEVLPFVPYEGNPVLEPGSPGEWDSDVIFAPAAVISDGVTYLLYAGTSEYQVSPFAIGYATSTDGLTLTKSASNPILSGDGTGFDANEVAPGPLLREDGTWVLYYGGSETTWSQTAVGQATAPTLAGPWSRLDDPVLPKGPPGAWDERFVAANSVIATPGGGYVMYYTGASAMLALRIGLATSPDGIHWTKHAGNPVLTPTQAWEGSDVYSAQVFQTPEGWEMFYTGGWNVRAIGYATSADGIHWTKYPANPILHPDDDPPAGSAVEIPAVVRHGDTYWIYYDYVVSYTGIGLARGLNWDPVEAVTITGPPALLPEANGLFSATYAPLTATWPVTLTWDNGSVGPTAVYSWTTSGVHTVTVTATNWLGTICDTFPVEVYCFEPYEGNPVLEPGPPGTWDDARVWAASTLAGDEVTYLFYSGRQSGGLYSTGLATSTDGLTFTKHPDPLLSGDGTGFDAGSVVPGPVLLEGGLWTMYYLGTVDDWVEGAVGRATATSPTGPWTRDENPVLTTGSPGEWDEGYIAASSVISTSQGYVMYYSAGHWAGPGEPIMVGLATSTDGITWTKYDDPATTDPPYAESDPVFWPGDPREWDWQQVFSPWVRPTADGWEMFYTGSGDNWLYRALGYATSEDGIVWQRYAHNPILRPEDDPAADTLLEVPSVIVQDGTYWMYYDYLGEIGLARSSVCCIPVESVTIAGPALLLPGETGHYTATYIPPGATPPVTLTWDSGATGPTAAYSWTVPGTYTLTVTATNCLGEVSGELAVVVCEAPSGAAFSWDPITPTVNESVIFSGTAAGWPAPTYHWAFGDGITGTGQIVAHTYAATGTYTVTMTAANDCGEDVVHHTLTVISGCNPVYDADFAWTPPEPEAGQVLTLTGSARGTAPFAFTWDLGDGTGDEGQVVTHTYPAAGDYAVVMTVTNCETGTATVAHILTVTAPPTICIPLEGVAVEGPAILWVGELGHYTATAIPITATPPIAYIWGDGTLGPTAAYSWTAAGTYTLTVTATNPCEEVVTGSYVVEVRAEEERYEIYLPLVLRNW